MVVTSKIEEPIPVTPTTPVERAIRRNAPNTSEDHKDNKTVSKGSVSHGDSQTHQPRPLFHPPIPPKDQDDQARTPQQTYYEPAVRFDLVGTHSPASAFHVVTPREEPSPLGRAHAPLAPLSRQKPKIDYSGPVDIDEVSFSSNNTTDDEEDEGMVDNSSWLPPKTPRDGSTTNQSFMATTFTNSEKHDQTPIVSNVTLEGQGHSYPPSPGTPLTDNTSNHARGNHVFEAESSMALPELDHAYYGAPRNQNDPTATAETTYHGNDDTAETTYHGNDVNCLEKNTSNEDDGHNNIGNHTEMIQQLASESLLPMSPPLSPLQLEESLAHHSRQDLLPQEDALLRPSEASPPLSPWNLDSRGSMERQLPQMLSPPSVRTERPTLMVRGDPISSTSYHSNSNRWSSSPLNLPPLERPGLISNNSAGDGKPKSESALPTSSSTRWRSSPLTPPDLPRPGLTADTSNAKAKSESHLDFAEATTPRPWQMTSLALPQLGRVRTSASTVNASNLASKRPTMPESPPMSTLKLDCSAQLASMMLPEIPTSPSSTSSNAFSTPILTRTGTESEFPRVPLLGRRKTTHGSNSSSTGNSVPSEAAVSTVHDVTTDSEETSRPLPSPPRIHRTTWLQNNDINNITDNAQENTQEIILKGLKDWQLQATEAPGAREGDNDQRKARGSHHHNLLHSSRSIRQQRHDSNRSMLSTRQHRRLKQKLDDAQRVVGIILKGSDFAETNEDLSTTAACFEAIRQFAMLKLELSNLETHFDTSKELLKQVFFEWQALQEVMQESLPIKKTEASQPEASKMDQSMAALQQLLSDDESIYKEDDHSDYNDASQDPQARKAGKNNDSDEADENEFCIESDVDQETDPVKAIRVLCHELRWEINNARVVWNDSLPQVKTTTTIQLKNEPSPKEPKVTPKETSSPDNSYNSTKSVGSLMDLVKNLSSAANDTTDDPLRTDDSYLLTKIEELTAEIEVLEKKNRDKASNSYMDKLANEVDRMDDKGFNLPISSNIDRPNSGNENMDETNDGSNTTAHPRNWTTFASHFPIYQVQESVVENGESTDEVDRQNKTGTANDRPDIARKSVSGSPLRYHPQRLLLRTRRFHASNDSYDPELILPIKMAESRGYSYERRELAKARDEQEYLNEDEDELVPETHQDIVDTEHVQNDTQIHDAGLEKKSLSFDSFFSPNHLSASMLYARNLVSASPTRSKTKLVRLVVPRGEGNPENLLPESSVLLVDPAMDRTRNVMNGHCSMDSKLLQKLRSPLLSLELSLPPKVVSHVVEELHPVRPTSPVVLESNGDPSIGNGYVKLRSKLLQNQQELQQAQARMELLYKQQQRTLLELRIAERHFQNLSSTQPAQQVTASPEAEKSRTSALGMLQQETQDLVEKYKHLSDSQGSATPSISRKQDPIVVETVLSSDEDEEEDEASVESRKNPFDTDRPFDGRKVLSQKEEECDRLSQQVHSLYKQLEEQMARVAELESQHATTPEPSASDKDFVNHVLRERDANHSKAIKLSQDLAEKEQEIEKLKAALIRKNPTRDDMSNMMMTNPSSTRSMPGLRVPVSGTVTVTKAKSTFRSLIPKRFTARKSDSGKKASTKTVPYKEMGEGPVQDEDLCGYATGHHEMEKTIDAIYDSTVSAQQYSEESSLDENDNDDVFHNEEGDDGNDDNNNEEDDNGSATSSSSPNTYAQFKLVSSADSNAKDDAQLATIHTLMSRIEQLEEENMLLKSHQTGQPHPQEET